MNQKGNSGISEQKGYSPREIQHEKHVHIEGGYQPTEGRLTTPPTTGSGAQTKETD